MLRCDLLYFETQNGLGRRVFAKVSVPGVRSRGRTERIRRVGIRERHPSFGQKIDVRRFKEFRRSIESRITPPQVISEDEDDVGTLLGRRGNSCECQGSDDCCE